MTKRKPGRQKTERKPSPTISNQIRDEMRDDLRRKFVLHYCSGETFGNRMASGRQAIKDVGYKEMPEGTLGHFVRTLLVEEETQRMISAFRQRMMDSEEHLILSSREALHRLSQIAMGSLEGHQWMTEKGRLKKVPVAPSFSDQRAALDTILKWWSLGETEEARTIAEFNRAWDEGLVNLTPDLRDIIAGERDAKSLARKLMPYMDQIRHDQKMKKMEKEQESEPTN